MTATTKNATESSPRSVSPDAVSLRGAAVRLLAAPQLLWGLAAIFAARALFFAVVAPDRPDARNFVSAGHALLFDRDHLYTAAAAALARTGTLPVPGEGFLYPPAAAFLAAPFALLPMQFAVWLWTAADAGAALAALFLLYRRLRLKGPQKPLFWLLVAYFPPFFAEVDAGQIGGFVLLLAMLSVLTIPRSPLLSGALAAAAAAIKVYPAALLAGAGARPRFLAGLLVGAPLLVLLSFAPLGPAAPAYYLRAVFIPATLQARYQDCAITSVKTLYLRTLGGETYYLPGSDGLVAMSLPIHFPAAALALWALTLAVIVCGGVWAVRRSGWHPAYGLCLALALGALVPAEVNPYQYLPLLPLVLIVAMQAAAAGRVNILVALLVALLGFVRPPCELPFPNLWTLAGLGAYAICVCQNGLFRHRQSEGETAHGHQRPGQLHLGRARHLEGPQRARQGDPDRPLGDEQPGRS